MNININTIHSNKHSSSLPQTQHGIVELYNLCNVWIQRQKTRRQLAQLPAYLLRDIGLTEADRYQESRKNFWEN
ncbi:MULTISPECIES: DUF1127 domain-containing protein [unclassified Agarivorans]|uniref:DUF1127 domain-containing protein n=1 Tax=unclassified Agarivorans TaxID=2636026 RepID=UPI003D7EEB71